MKLLSVIHQDQRKMAHYAILATILLLLFMPSKAFALCYIDTKKPDGTIERKVQVKITFPPLSIDPIDNIYFYSDIDNVDKSYTPVVTGSSGIGDWSYEYVTLDHNGNSLLGGTEGIRFYLTAGDGISTGEDAYFSFAVLSDSGTSFSDYHDSASGTWADAVNCPACPEPGSMALMGVGLAILGYRKYSRDMSIVENA